MEGRREKDDRKTEKTASRPRAFATPAKLANRQTAANANVGASEGGDCSVKEPESDVLIGKKKKKNSLTTLTQDFTVGPLYREQEKFTGSAGRVNSKCIYRPSSCKGLVLLGHC